VSPPEAKASPEPDDDMHDRGDRGAAFPLGEFLRICDPHAGSRECAPCLRSDYERADGLARHGQRRHLKFVRWSVRCGFAALFWGLFQQLVIGGSRTAAAWWPEAVFTAATLVLVLLTLFLETHQTWLVERYKAEALRLVKFRVLIRPGLWNGDTADLRALQNDLEARRARVADTPHEVLEALAHSDALPDLPATRDSERVDAKSLERLLEYYRRKRLDFQLAYFERKMREKKGVLQNALLQPFFFFFAIGLSMVVLLLESPWVQSDKETLKHSLIFFSLALPFGWGAIRTLRGANERSRNQARSHARHDSLAEIRRSLDAATGKAPEQWDRAMIFGYLYLCESILASDQHEWLRLMKEAEAYG
jgi:hypothetical protein